ncbi:hypothetical protein T01_14628 [Trichinella spiralis]|uniref:Uncharacterized protein n=1 Tax=Trichinella spiralis TaxID=6334 RepID=A0A0V1BK56_TRISP|nr:hypothetical protein T01_14628 [Trichinella spiralis]
MYLLWDSRNAANVRIRWPLLLLHEGHFVQEFSFWFKQADVKSLAMMLPIIYKYKTNFSYTNPRERILKLALSMAIISFPHLYCLLPMTKSAINVNVILPCADLSFSKDDYATARYCSNRQESSTTGANRPFNEDMVNAIDNEKIEQLTPHSNATAGIDS